MLSGAGRPFGAPGLEDLGGRDGVVEHTVRRRRSPTFDRATHAADPPRRNIRALHLQFNYLEALPKDLGTVCPPAQAVLLYRSGNLLEYYL